MKTYKVFVDDNFHYQDADERTLHSEFPTSDSAVAACKAIVDRSLSEALEPGITAGKLWLEYTMFGDDPFVVPDVGFSAWDYAKSRASELCAPRDDT